MPSVEVKTAPNPPLFNENLANTTRHKKTLPRWRTRLRNTALSSFSAALALSTGVSADAPSNPNMLKPDKQIEKLMPSFRFSTYTVDLPPDFVEKPQLPFNDHFRGADIGAAVRLPNGKLFMVFGDTYISKKLPNGEDKWRMIHNSAAIIDDLTGKITYLQGPDAKGMETTLINPSKNDGSYYWFMSPLVTNNGTELIIPLTKNKPPIPGKPNYFGDFAGTDLAIFKLTPGNTYPQFKEIVELPRDKTANEQTYWGSATLQMEDPETHKMYTYIYGTTVHANPDDPWKTTRDVRIARVANGDLARFTAWEFWDGTTWQTVEKPPNSITGTSGNPTLKENWQHAEAKATPIVTDPSMRHIDKSISTGFSVIKINGKIVMVNKSGEFLTNEVDAAAADRPQGPFGPNHVIIPQVLNYKDHPKFHTKAGAEITYGSYIYKGKNGKYYVVVSKNFLPDPASSLPEQTAAALNAVRHEQYGLLIFPLSAQDILQP